jgi:hypothetical protein
MDFVGVLAWPVSATCNWTVDRSDERQARTAGLIEGARHLAFVARIGWTATRNRPRKCGSSFACFER